MIREDFGSSINQGHQLGLANLLDHNRSSILAPIVQMPEFLAFGILCHQSESSLFARTQPITDQLLQDQTVG